MLLYIKVTRTQHMDHNMWVDMCTVTSGVKWHTIICNTIHSYRGHSYIATHYYMGGYVIILVDMCTEYNKSSGHQLHDVIIIIDSVLSSAMGEKLLCHVIQATYMHCQLP